MADILDYPRRDARNADSVGDTVNGTLHATSARLRADAEGVRQSMRDLDRAVAELKALDLPARAREIALASAESVPGDVLAARPAR